MASTQNWKGVPMPEEVREAVDTGRLDDPYPSGWVRGVDDALASRRDLPSDTGALKITGWTKDVVRAFAHVVEDDPDTAVRLVADMSAKDRAVLSFWLRELEEIVDSAETARRSDTNTRVRATVRSRTDGQDTAVRGETLEGYEVPGER